MVAVPDKNIEGTLTVADIHCITLRWLHCNVSCGYWRQCWLLMCTVQFPSLYRSTTHYTLLGCHARLHAVMTSQWQNNRANKYPNIAMIAMKIKHAHEEAYLANGMFCGTMWCCNKRHYMEANAPNRGSSRCWIWQVTKCWWLVTSTYQIFPSKDMHVNMHWIPWLVRSCMTYMFGK